MDGRPVVAITGANGYLGGVCCDAFAGAGYEVRRLVRRPEFGRGDRGFSLDGGCDAGALDGVDVLIHCAYDFAPRSRRGIWSANVVGTRALLDAARAASVRRVILISSMSAYAGTRQLYGRAKLASELDAVAIGATVVRPGLVYGPRWGGTVGSLRTLASLPIVPLVGGRTHQFTVHEDDLASGLLAVAESAPPSVPIGLAHPTPVPFRALLTEIGHSATGRSPRFFPIPWRALYAVMRLGEVLHLPLPLRADSLLGLVRPAPTVPNPEVLADLGVTVRPFSLDEFRTAD